MKNLDNLPTEHQIEIVSALKELNLINESILAKSGKNSEKQRDRDKRLDERLKELKTKV